MKPCQHIRNGDSDGQSSSPLLEGKHRTQSSTTTTTTAATRPVRTAVIHLVTYLLACALPHQSLSCSDNFQNCIPSATKLTSIDRTIGIARLPRQLGNESSTSSLLLAISECEPSSAPYALFTSQLSSRSEPLFMLTCIKHVKKSFSFWSGTLRTCIAAIAALRRLQILVIHAVNAIALILLFCLLLIFAYPAGKRYLNFHTSPNAGFRL